MQKSFGFFGAVAAVMLSGSSHGQTDPMQPSLVGGGASDEHGLQLGLRAGYGVPLGSAANNATGGGSLNQSDLIKGMIPLWADVGYRFNPNWYLGGFFQFGIGFAPSNCNDCTLNDLRFGINIHYHLMPSETFDPWIGIGGGYEITNFSQGPASGNFKGFEFGNAQLGLDFKVAPTFSVGPFVAFTIAQYSDASVSIPGFPSQGTSITNKAIHEWLAFGLRGAFNLNLD